MKENENCPYDLCDICCRSLPPCCPERKRKNLASNGIAVINSLDEELQDIVDGLYIVRTEGALSDEKGRDLLSDIKEVIRALRDVEEIIIDLQKGGSL